MRGLLLAWAIVAVSSAAMAEVDLELRVPARVARVGMTIEVGLYAVSDEDGDQAIGGIDAILSWDPDSLELTGKIDNGSYSWLAPMFPDDSGLDGLNADCGADVFCNPYTGLPFNDGDALYQALRQFPPNPPPYATPEGLLVTTIRFTALAPAQATEIGLLENVDTQWTTVADIYASNVTGELRPVTLSIVSCGTWGDFNGDCEVDLVDFGPFESCLTGPGTASVGTECQAGDFDGDGDVDLHDFREFQLAFAGS